MLSFQHHECVDEEVRTLNTSNHSYSYSEPSPLTRMYESMMNRITLYNELHGRLGITTCETACGQHYFSGIFHVDVAINKGLLKLSKYMKISNIVTCESLIRTLLHRYGDKDMLPYDYLFYVKAEGDGGEFPIALHDRPLEVKLFLDTDPNLRCNDVQFQLKYIKSTDRRDSVKSILNYSVENLSTDMKQKYLEAVMPSMFLNFSSVKIKTGYLKIQCTAIEKKWTVLYTVLTAETLSFYKCNKALKYPIKQVNVCDIENVVSYCDDSIRMPFCFLLAVPAHTYFMAIDAPSRDDWVTKICQARAMCKYLDHRNIMQRLEKNRTSSKSSGSSMSQRSITFDDIIVTEDKEIIETRFQHFSRTSLFQETYCVCARSVSLDNRRKTVFFSLPSPTVKSKLQIPSCAATMPCLIRSCDICYGRRIEKNLFVNISEMKTSKIRREIIDINCSNNNSLNSEINYDDSVKHDSADRSHIDRTYCSSGDSDVFNTFVPNSQFDSWESDYRPFGMDQTMREVVASFQLQKAANRTAEGPSTYDRIPLAELTGFIASLDRSEALDIQETVVSFLRLRRYIMALMESRTFTNMASKYKKKSRRGVLLKFTDWGCNVDLRKHKLDDKQISIKNKGKLGLPQKIRSIFKATS